jgi:very-short-patch-repair endonuclease
MSETPAPRSAPNYSAEQASARQDRPGQPTRRRWAAPARVRGVDTLSQLLQRQHQVISRGQALAYGLTDDMLRYRLRDGGPWQRLLPGVFVAEAGTPTIDQRETAALLYAGRWATLTGPAALRQFDLWPPAAKAVDVLVPVSTKRQSRDYVVLHRTRRLPRDVCVRGPLHYALPSRAVADAARALTDIGSARALLAKAVQSKWCTAEELMTELENGPTRGSALLRKALSDVARGARSAPEAELMGLITRARLPQPLYNAKLLVGDEIVAIADVWWPEFSLVVEVDSKEWHLSPDDWDYTMFRHDELTALGIRVLHFTPRQIREEPQKVIRIIKRALASRGGIVSSAVQTVPSVQPLPGH